MPSISAVALPDHLDDSMIQGQIAVVIDVLRATTTIAHALEHGASCVVPVASVDSARMLAHERAGAMLCGERGGIRPEGFELGNSPLEYARGLIADRDLVLTTTNGTRAMHMCSGAHGVYTGSVTNIGALCELLAEQDRDVVLVCSGTDRRVSLEDCICAGLIAERLGASHELDDSALLMRHAAEGVIERCAGIEGAIGSSFHARRLVDMGFRADVAYAAVMNSSGCVPFFDAATGEIRPANQLNRSHG